MGGPCHERGPPESRAFTYSTACPNEPLSIPIPLTLILLYPLRGYQCRMEPRGSLLIPPDFNVGLTDWERSKRLRKVSQGHVGYDR